MYVDKHTIFFLVGEVISLKTAKGLMLIGLGVGGTLMYQKYGKCAVKEVEKVVDKTMRKADHKLEEMM